MSKYFGWFQHSEEQRLEKRKAELLKEKFENHKQITALDKRDVEIDEELKAINERLEEIKSEAKA